MEILFLGAIILVALVLFVTELFPIDVTALLVLGLLLILGLVSPTESLAGFSNPAVITIACLFILSHALQKSHVLEYLIININSLIDKSRVLGMIAYLFAIGVASAVVNNTAIVAIFMPVTIRLADKYNISPSKVLIPLSYAAILGYNYNSSEWFKKSYKIFNRNYKDLNKEIKREDKQSFFKKIIKIIK